MSHLPLILPVIWLAVISPRADFAMISRVSCIDGRRAGIMAALGIALGCWLHIAYAVFGLGIVAPVSAVPDGFEGRRRTLPDLARLDDGNGQIGDCGS